MTAQRELEPWREDILRRIRRCPTCGAWEVITQAEKRIRQADLMPTPTVCHHLNPEAFEATA